jgi:hypothetical protein
MTDHLTSFVSKVRELDLKKLPSVSETIDWAKSLVLLHADSLDEELVRSSLNALLKYEDDLSTVVDNLTELLSQDVKASQAS